MTKNLAVLATFFLLACGVEPPQAPLVHFTLKGEALPEYAAAIVVWAPLGFSEGDGAPPCERDWYTRGQVDCTIAVQLERGDTGVGRIGYALRSEALIVLDAGISGDTLIWAAAHELGHVLLDTGEHLGPGQAGVMSAWFSTQLTNADLELACRAIRICV